MSGNPERGRQGYPALDKEPLFSPSARPLPRNVAPEGISPWAAFNFLVVPAPLPPVFPDLVLRVGRVSRLSPNSDPSQADSPSD